jgi:hypothetical protein
MLLSQACVSVRILHMVVYAKYLKALSEPVATLLLLHALIPTSIRPIFQRHNSLQLNNVSKRQITAFEFILTQSYPELHRS